MNSRDKGKRGEREAAAFLNLHFGLKARRGVQFHGGAESPDVVGVWDGTHCEVKRVENLNLDKAIEQAVGDAGKLKIPFILHRTNHNPWLITVRAEDLAQFVARVKENNSD